MNKYRFIQISEKLTNQQQPEKNTFIAAYMNLKGYSKKMSF